MEINKIDHREDDIGHADQQGDCQLVVKGKGTEEPIVTVRALHEPSALDKPPASRTVYDLSGFSLFP